ncbi:MAG TPA: hypothetical protein VIC86_02570 [Acidimicrobiales bacterium]
MEQDQPERRRIVVDGSNIATEGRSLPSLAQLDEAIRSFLEEYRGFTTSDVTVVVDASFGHRIDPSEVTTYEQALEHGEMITPPAGALGRGDGFILRIAEKSGALVLSNDSFQEFHGERPWLFDPGRLIGGKPVPGVGWIFTPRTPVRGAKSRSATKSVRSSRSRDGVGPAASIDGDDQASGMESDGVSPRRGAKATSAPKAAKTASAAKTAKAAKAANPAKTAKPVKASKETKADKPATATKPAKKSKTADASKMAKKAKSADASKTAKPAKPAKKAKATEPSKAAKPAKPDKPAKAATAARAAESAKSGRGAGSPGAKASLEADGPPPADKSARAGSSGRAGTRRAPEALNDPMTFLTFVADHPVGSTLDGTVVAFTSHGAHIDVGGMLCHVPLRGLARPAPNKARQVLTKGETRTFVLVSLDAARRRAELALPGVGE